MCYYVTVFPFIGLAVIFFMEKYGYEAKQANIINSLVSGLKVDYIESVALI